MKKGLMCLVAILLLAPGCNWRKDKKEPRKGKKKTELRTEVDIPVAGDEIKSSFDNDVNEFTLLEGEEKGDEAIADLDLDVNSEVLNQAVSEDDSFSWAKNEESEDAFKNVYFDFDEYVIRDDQEGCVAQDVDLAKKTIARGESPVLTVEGNACSSAGSRSYNLAISNSRAGIVADRLVASGVPRENLKIVGRGQDAPVLDSNGNPVSGDREQQWPNRRVEIKVYS